MKKTTLLFIALVASFISFSQEVDTQAIIDSIEQSYTFKHGTIPLKGGIGKIIIPDGFKYLDPEQSEQVLVDLWGNPKSDNMTLGLILPENQGLLSDEGYVFNIQYDEIGYVKDDDADDIDYDDLLDEMQEDSKKENKARIKEGYEPISIVGWAAKPYYDKDRKILHWAKEIKFGDIDVNTLNYNIRVLGRKGVLVLNAISTMPNLTLVQSNIGKVLDIVRFSDGYKYEDFDSSIDEVAAWTIGGLVAGKLLAKAGFFAVILKFWKIIVLAVIGLFKPISNRFKKKKNNDVSKELIDDTTKELTE